MKAAALAPVRTARLACFPGPLFHRDQVEEDLDAEIQAHFELLAAPLTEMGMWPEPPGGKHV